MNDPAPVAAPMPAKRRQVLLAHGLDHGDLQLLDAEIGAMDACRIAVLVEQCEPLTPARRVTRLLTAALRKLGTFAAPVDAELVSRLTAGDREALLIAFRGAVLGPVIRSQVSCPKCAERLETDLFVDDLILPTKSAQRSGIEVEAEDPHQGTVHLRCRLPNGQDLEAAADAARIDPEHAARALVAACVESALRSDGGPASLTTSVLDAVADAVVAGDPQAEIVFALDCPKCGESFRTLFDSARFVFAELTEVAREFWRDVHEIAQCYHWSEAAIVQLPAARRARYLRLIRAGSTTP